MKQIVPFYKEIVFENKIANLISVSLEHKEKAQDGEVTGEFIVYGSYKSHNDTTETENFLHKLPFTTLLPDDIDINTVTVDISNFNYEQIEENVLRIDIEFLVEGNEKERQQDNNILSEEELDELLEGHILNDQEPEPVDVKDIIESENEERQEQLIETPINQEIITEKESTTNKVETEQIKEEYVTYHVHVVSNKDSIESIIKTYNISMDLLKEYNDIKELKIGDKVLIPEYLDE